MKAESDKFYLRITRTDGSVTFKGPWVFEHCRREWDAWRKVDIFAGYTHVIAPKKEMQAEVRLWEKAVKSDSYGQCGRYWPAETLEGGET